ncbi:MAG: hypothetical protein OEW18_13500 [Candidatus Aminicenantes bacterium]|nr:hypothetical protein [Candidatus Aminicenantes bacterium]
MPKVNLFADSLRVVHNGKPEDIDKKYIQRKSSYILKVSLYSPGYNSNKNVEGAISFLDIGKGEVDFSSSFGLEDIHLLTCSFGRRLELRASLTYVEYEDFLAAVLRSVTERLAGKFIDYAKKLDLHRIAVIPAEILPVFIDVIKNGVERKSNMYEIGSGKLTSLEMGVQEVALSVDKEVKRALVFWKPGRDDYGREEVVLVPRGPNGGLKLLAEPV